MKKYTVMRIVVTALYSAVTLFLAVMLASVFWGNPESAERGISLAVWLIVFWLMVGGGGYLLTTVLSLIMAILSAKRGAPCGVRALFVVFSILPAVTMALYYLVAVLVA